MTTPANANGHRRRELRARVLAEEGTCHVCGKPVDKSLTYSWGEHGPRCAGNGCPGCVPHPMRAEVDEVIPRSQGGSPLDRDNCRLAHRTCNRERSVKPKVEHEPTWPMTDSWGSLLAGLTR